MRFTLLILAISSNLYCEVAAPPVQSAAQSPQQVGSVPAQPRGATNSNTIPVFDSNFFDSKPSSPETREYTSDQYNQWTGNCEKYKKQGMKEFRDCFNEEKRSGLKAIKQGFDDVERKQQAPMNNIPATVTDFKRLPGPEEND